jgi:hypothetical protein
MGFLKELFEKKLRSNGMGPAEEEGEEEEEAGAHVVGRSHSEFHLSRPHAG